MNGNNMKHFQIPCIVDYCSIAELAYMNLFLHMQSVVTRIQAHLLAFFPFVYFLHFLDIEYFCSEQPAFAALV